MNVGGGYCSDICLIKIPNKNLHVVQSNSESTSLAVSGALDLDDYFFLFDNSILLAPRTTCSLGFPPTLSDAPQCFAGS